MFVPKEEWTHFYDLAVSKVNGKQLSERIVDARRAIARRLQDLTGDENHRNERERIAKALKSLQRLEELEKG